MSRNFSKVTVQIWYSQGLTLFQFYCLIFLYWLRNDTIFSTSLPIRKSSWVMGIFNLEGNPIESNQSENMWNADGNLEVDFTLENFALDWVPALYKIHQFYKECSTSLLGLHSASYSVTWLSLEFHYVSKGTSNDMASQVKVDSSMTRDFPPINPGWKQSCQCKRNHKASVIIYSKYFI